MAMYRKLGKKTKLRKALLRNQVTALIYNGKITTTEARAKEIRKIVEPMITMAVKERDNYETVTVMAKVARKDKDGKRVKEVVDGKKVTVYDEVEKQVTKDAPSRLHARRQILRYLSACMPEDRSFATCIPSWKFRRRQRAARKAPRGLTLLTRCSPSTAPSMPAETVVIPESSRSASAAAMVR